LAGSVFTPAQGGDKMTEIQNIRVKAASGSALVSA
jgi:hypothetical protein